MKTRIRRIDRGTRYDITGNLRKLVRDIESGKLGQVRDIVFAIRTIRVGGAIEVDTRHVGTGTMETALYTWEAARKDIV